MRQPTLSIKRGFAGNFKIQEKQRFLALQNVGKTIQFSIFGIGSTIDQ
jgi:hypothetical protein